MHELSLAMNVVKIAETEVKKSNAQSASAITLEIGG
jgi:Zn finger protein HypA/HybF involved in hydrogenase expression